MAINNLDKAISHVERAQKKLEGRLARNQKNLTRLKSNKRTNYPKVLAPVENLIKKNTAGIENCKEMVTKFRKAQGLLYCMVHTIGIKRSKASQSVYLLMGNYAGKTTNCEKIDCEECPLIINQN